MQYLKKRKVFEAPFESNPDIVYKACKFCGSNDYDVADGDVDDNNVYEPTTCDCCGFGNVRFSEIPIH